MTELLGQHEKAAKKADEDAEMSSLISAVINATQCWCKLFSSFSFVFVSKKDGNNICLVSNQFHLIYFLLFHFFFICQSRRRFIGGADLQQGANSTLRPLLPILKEVLWKNAWEGERGQAPGKATGTGGEGRVGGLVRPGSTVLPICRFKGHISWGEYKLVSTVVCSTCLQSLVGLKMN